MDKLREHRDRQLLEKATTRRWEDSEYVFTRENGSLLNPSTLTRAFRWIVDRSELPRIRLHDLRHTHASIAVRRVCPSVLSASGWVTPRRSSLSTSTPM